MPEHPSGQVLDQGYPDGERSGLPEVTGPWRAFLSLGHRGGQLTK
jgi:hypothetical protein